MLKRLLKPALSVLPAGHQHSSPQEKNPTFTERLVKLGYDPHDPDKLPIPTLLCDSILHNPLDDPMMIDTVRDHVLDKTTIQTLPNKNENPFDRAKISFIPTNMDELKAEIEKIRASDTFKKYELLKLERMRLSLQRDAFKHFLATVNHSPEKKLQLETQLQEYENCLQKTNVTLRPIEQSTILLHLLRLENQVKLLIQREEFISSLEKIDALRQKIDAAMEKLGEKRKWLAKKQDLLSECFQFILAIHADEINKIRIIQDYNESLNATLQAYIKLTKEIIDSEHQDDGTNEHPSVLAEKEEEKNKILATQNYFLFTIPVRMKELSAQSVQQQQLMDRKKDCIKHLEQTLLSNVDLKSVFDRVSDDFVCIMEDKGLPREQIDELLGDKVLLLMEHCVQVIDAMLDAEGFNAERFIEIFQLKMNEWQLSQAPQLQLIYKNNYKKSADKINQLRTELKQLRDDATVKLKIILEAVKLKNDKVEEIIAEQRADMEKLEPIVSKKFVLATELETCIKLAAVIDAQDDLLGTLHVFKALRDKIYQELRALEMKSSTSSGFLPIKLASTQRIVRGHLLLTGSGFQSGMFGGHNLQPGRHRSTALDIPDIDETHDDKNKFRPGSV